MSKTMQTKIPKLRFPEFSGEWEERRLQDVLKIGSGRDYKHLGSGNIPVYGTGGYMLSVDQALYDGESVMIGRKGTIDKPVYITGKFWTVDTLFYTHDFGKNVPKFIFYIFQQINWEKYNEASGVPSLSKDTIYKIKTTITQPGEQQKIASFLSIVDELIGNLKKQKENLEKYKKGMMQKIFSKEVRFKIKKESGELVEPPEWEEKKLGEVFERVTRKNKENNKNVLTISAQQGLVDQEKYFKKSVSAKNVTGYYLLYKGEFAYNKSYSKGYPIGVLKKLNKYPKGVVSTLYICFKLKNINDSGSFFEQYFEGGFANNEIGKITQEGARAHGRTVYSI